MATYSKSVLDALTENPAQLFVDFLKFLESTQPITVPSTSAIRGSFYICYLWYVYKFLLFNMFMHILAITVFIFNHNFDNFKFLLTFFASLNEKGRGALGVAHIPNCTNIL
ncbi:uncharacterized protein LOC124809910 isoform X1 [Hydra vulgaris]|uniref:uncharacterized protein LOC124809910 isoform X1 n=1 Tax=Hydra vulgaris TaxID=6087 RepID=UPI0032EA12DF